MGFVSCGDGSEVVPAGGVRAWGASCPATAASAPLGGLPCQELAVLGFSFCLDFFIFDIKKLKRLLLSLQQMQRNDHK